MNTFLLNIGASELKPATSQQEKAPAVEPRPEIEPADKKPFQQTLDKQRQPVAVTKTTTQTTDTDKQTKTKVEAHAPQASQEVEPEHQVAVETTEALIAPSMLDEALLLTTEQRNQQESDQAEMDISTLMESTQPSTKPLKTAVGDEQESDQYNDPNMLLAELNPFAALMKQEEAGALQFHWQNLAKAERGSSHQAMPHQLLGEALADVKTQLLDGGENSTGLTSLSLLNPSKLNNQLGLMSLQAGVEQRIDFPLLHAATHETAQSHLSQFPALQLTGSSINANSAQLAQPSVVASQLPLPMPHPNWGQQFSDRVVWLVQQGVKTAHIQLDPPDLGMVEVRVQVTQDQANVQFTSHHASVRESIEAQLVRLRDMFAQQGIDLVNVDVSSQQFAESNRQSGFQADATEEMDEEQDTTTAEANVGEQGVGLVDYFV